MGIHSFFLAITSFSLPTLRVVLSNVTLHLVIDLIGALSFIPYITGSKLSLAVVLCFNIHTYFTIQ